MIEIPLNAVPAQEIEIILNKQECTLSLRSRNSVLFLDLHVGDTEIAKGAICNDRTPIITKPTSEFEGNFYFVDDLGTSHPTYDGIGLRYFLLYATPAETEQIDEYVYR